ncbi:hypothetical protein OG552_04415 [Streptomyces sp. NBC_01476]|uniref:hypothetical protein n=1 Tax=Streptomyces sp. NBC_01476 TaxID=2903881 RepID=UPI002E31B834|nr:hypothetical protein [Streptomyces sp. NBC_01476]
MITLGVEEEYFLLDPDTGLPAPGRGGRASAAARYGLTGTLIDTEGVSRPAHDVVSDLVDHLTPAFDAAGDTRQVLALTHRLPAEGGPAQRQLRAFARDGVKGVIELITAQNVAIEH